MRRKEFDAKPKMRLLLVDDHAVFRDGLNMLLAEEEDFEVVGEAENGREALRKVRELRPDIVVMDISMPDMTGLEATEAIKKSHPEVKILALTAYENENYLQRLLRAGASGYVIKRAAATELMTAVRTVAKGDVYIHPTMAKHLAESMKHPEGQSREREGLSEREWEVLRLIALGHTNQEIAEKLFISIKTVETYRSRIAVKLNLKSRSEIVRFALKHGLLTEEP